MPAPLRNAQGKGLAERLTAQVVCALQLWINCLLELGVDVTTHAG